MIEKTNEPDKREFSLVSGGPLFQLWRRIHLSGSGLELVERRIIVICAFAWLPLLLLSLYEGNAFGGDIKVPFLSDVGVYTRFLVALPILIGGEVYAHHKFWPSAKSFLQREIIVDEEIPRFREAIDSAIRIRNSVTIEVVLLVIVYTLGIWFWSSQIAFGAASWYATPDGTNMNLTLAGYWFAFVSIPLVQFITLRWYFRFFVWFRFLWRVSRLNLHLVATHPDRSAGLGFLGKATYGFGPILSAQGALLTGFIAGEVLNNGGNLMDFRVTAAGFLIFFVCAVLSPLAVFVPALTVAKRHGLGLYGDLASRYVGQFEEKWIEGRNPAGEGLLGTGDIQSLADLGNSYTVVREMNLAPFIWKDVMRLAAAAAAPLLPLALLVFSPEEIIEKLLKILIG